MLLKLMDAMGYSLLNLTAGDIALMGKVPLQKTAVLSANFQGQNASFEVLKEFDYTDAQGRKFRFFGVYDAPDPRFSNVREWLAAATLPADRTCILLYYADRQPDAETQGLLKKFDAVIANIKLPEDVPAFVPLAKGKQVAVLSVQEKRISGRDILVDEHVIGDPEMLDLVWREQSALSKRVDESERMKYLRMSPEEFINSYQKEAQ